MPEIKISALDLAPVTPTGTEVFAVVQGSTTHKTTIDSLKPALVDNLSAGAPTWDANGNLTAGYDIIAGGNHAGKVALTINDGGGNANLTFNHTDGIPDASGSSGRISCAVDSNLAEMSFQLKGSVTIGTAPAMSTVLKLQDNNIQLLKATTCLTPTQNTHVARKDYVDTALNLKATTASVTAVSQSLTNHIGATTSHTKAQVGLGNVDNTTDINKPISTATQTALNGKIGESEINTGDFTFASNTLSLKTILEGQIGTGAITATKIGTGAVSPGKLSTGAPTWTETGEMTFAGNIYADQIIGRESADSLILRADPQSPTPTTGGPQIELYSADAGSTANQIYVKSSFVYFDTVATTPARFAGINPNGPTAAKDLTTKEYVDTAINSSAITGLLSIPLSKNYPSYYIQGTVISGSLTGVWSGQGIGKFVSETIIFSLRNLSTGSTIVASFYDLTEDVAGDRDNFSVTRTFTRANYTIPTSGLYQLETSSNFTTTSGATATPPV